MEDQQPPKPVDKHVKSARSSEKFLAFITRMGSAHHWVFRDVDDEHAVIEFSLDADRPQTLFIFNIEDNLEFSVPSFAAFDSMEQVPHFISSTLLQVNAKTKIGFWCMEKIGEKFVYSYMHNTGMATIDESEFGEIVHTLIQRVDEFEKLLMNMSGTENPRSEQTQ